MVGMSGGRAVRMGILCGGWAEGVGVVGDDDGRGEVVLMVGGEGGIAYLRHGLLYFFSGFDWIGA